MIHVKSAIEIGSMREGGKILSEILNDIEARIEPGIKRSELNRFAARLCLKHGVKPSFLGYNDYPGSICISLNNEVVHGLPTESQIKEGDLVSIDMGVLYRGLHTDSARTFICGNARAEDRNKLEKLIKITEKSFFASADIIKEGVRLGDVSAHIQKIAESAGFGVIRMLVGHGIGKTVHEEPQVPNYGIPGTGIILKAGMTLAIEPMLTMSGCVDVVLLSDGWTYVTADGSLSAHFEHTVLVTKDGCEILTRGV